MGREGRGIVNAMCSEGAWLVLALDCKVAMLKARGVWVVGREGEAKGFLWWRFLQKCT